MNLVDDLTLAMIGFLDCVGTDLLQRHCRLPWIADDWVLLAIEFRVITLAVPVHLEPVGGHLVLDRARGVVSLEYPPLPGARNGMRAGGSRGDALRLHLK